MSLNKAKTFTITSTKGGVGKTITTLNLAGMYEKLGKKVLIIDLDFYSGDVAASLNVKVKKDLYNMYEDITNNKFTNIEDYICIYDEYIHVLAAPKDPRFGRKIGNKILNLILYKCGFKYDVILIDTNHILTDINLFALDYSDCILYIMNNDLMNLKGMKSMISIMRDMNKNNYKIIMNKSTCRDRNYFNKSDIRNIINKNMNYIIPESFNIKLIDRYTLNGKILTLEKNIIKKHKKAIKIFDMIAKDLLKESKGEEDG